MTDRDAYTPAAAYGAEVQKEGDTWTLVLVRDLRHAPDKVWQALVDPAQLHEWAPFDADGRLDAAGAKVTLSTVGAPQQQAAVTTIRRADAPHTLEYDWGGQKIRWELRAIAGGARLTLWHAIDRRYIAMGAAGWHICLDVLDRLVAGHPLGRIVGGEAMKFDWPRLNKQYAAQFGVAPVRP